MTATEDYAGTVYDIIRTIKDPEKPGTLEDLDVVYEEGVSVQQLDHNCCNVQVRYRVKLERQLPTSHKVSIFITEGMHNTEEDINKQINDKERTAAAMENPGIKNVVERCITEPD